MQEFPLISLKAARVNAGLSQEKASKLLGISKSTLQSYENGTTIPDILLSRKIACAYQFPADYIFFGQKNALSAKTNG